MQEDTHLAPLPGPPESGATIWREPFEQSVVAVRMAPEMQQMGAEVQWLAEKHPHIMSFCPLQPVRVHDCAMP